MTKNEGEGCEREGDDVEEYEAQGNKLLLQVLATIGFFNNIHYYFAASSKKSLVFVKELTDLFVYCKTVPFPDSLIEHS